MVFVAIWPSLYTLYQIFLLYPLGNGHWAYPFMNTNTILVVPWLVGLVVLHLVFFGSCFGLGRLCKRGGGNEGVSTQAIGQGETQAIRRGLRFQEHVVSLI